VFVRFDSNYDNKYCTNDYQGIGKNKSELKKGRMEKRANNQHVYSIGRGVPSNFSKKRRRLSIDFQYKILIVQYFVAVIYADNL